VTPAVRLVLLALVGLAALTVVFWLVGTHWQGPGGFLAAIAAQDLRFWMQIVTGLGAWLISAWVWALKPRNPDVALFALSGLATLTFTFSFAPPSAVDVALPVGLMSLLFHVNFVGAVAFYVARSKRMAS